MLSESVSNALSFTNNLLLIRDAVWCRQGAAEWVLQKCTHFLNTDGLAEEMTEEQRAALDGVVTDMASRGLRTLCLAYTDLPLIDDSRPPDFFEAPHVESLIATCIVGIKVCGAVLSLISRCKTM